MEASQSSPSSNQVPSYEQLQEQVSKLKEKLMLAEEAIESTHSMLTYVTYREKEQNDKLVSICKSLKNYFPEGRRKNVTYGVRLAGEIDKVAFIEACKSLPNPQFDPNAPEFDSNAAKLLLSQFKYEIKDTKWHPFEIVEIDGKQEEVIKEDDPRIMQIREQYGQQIYSMVTASLCELHKYNPSGGYPVKVLWDYKHNREAEVVECVEQILNENKALKRKARSQFNLDRYI